MESSPNDLPIGARYKLLTGLVVPRPIAWVSSYSCDGTANLAPFSYFSIVGHDPMAISISVTGRKPDGSEKDTGRNLMPVVDGGQGAFVVNIVSQVFAEAMAQTARPLPTYESEFRLAGLSIRPAKTVKAPAVDGVFAALECRTIAVLPIGSARVVIGEVVHLTIDEHIIDSSFRIDFDRLMPVGRLAGGQYAKAIDRFTIADEGFFPNAGGSRS